MKWYQHGDVTLKPVSAIPEKSETVKHNVLMEGELTGHRHTVVGECNLFQKETTLYLQANGEVTIKHQEHKPLTVPEGTYVVGQVREFDFFEDEIRNVRD